MKPAVITGARAIEMLVAETTTVHPVKISRKCPKCFKRARHWGNHGGVAHRILCINCGHVWTGRVLNAEKR